MCIVCVISTYLNEERAIQTIKDTHLEMAASVLSTDASDMVKLAFARSLVDTAQFMLSALGASDEYKNSIDQVTTARRDFVANARPEVAKRITKMTGEFYQKYGVMPPPEVHNAILSRAWDEEESAHDAKIERGAHSVQDTTPRCSRCLMGRDGDDDCGFCATMNDEQAEKHRSLMQPFFKQ